MPKFGMKTSFLMPFGVGVCQRHPVVYSPRVFLAKQEATELRKDSHPPGRRFWGCYGITVRA